MKLIKLTSHKNDEPIYINIDKIDYFYERQMGNKYYEGKPIIEKLTKVGYNGSVSEVKETPEEIVEKIRLIKNASSTHII
jgi:hypothetical protein